jgi:hypothetical protein
LRFIGFGGVSGSLWVGNIPRRERSAFAPALGREAPSVDTVTLNDSIVFCLRGKQSFLSIWQRQ